MLQEWKRMPRRELYTQPELLREMGRPRLICKFEVGKDARMLGIRGW